MITRRTVFVLGAGASAAYGFPSGEALAARIHRHIQKESSLRDALVAICGRALVDSFPQQFTQSAHTSLDAFVQRRTEFRQLAKAAIVHELVPCEVEDRLLQPRAEGRQDHDWYGYLLRKMLPAQADDFTRNLLQVITFNFDRSFERRLFLALSANYGLDVAQGLASHVPVLHVHGALGEPGWLEAPQRFDATTQMESRDYSPTPLAVKDIATFAEYLHLVDDEISDHTRDVARAWLRQAEEVCFLGFSYHPNNMARLGMKTIEQTGRIVRGTAHGISRGELAAIKLEFNHNGGGPHLYDDSTDCSTILEFLRQMDTVHR